MAEKEIKVVDYRAMSDDELSLLSEKDHHLDVKQYDIQQNALALVMIGSLTLVAGVLFLILSFRRVMNRMRGIDFYSLQFFVCIACFIAAVTLLSIGLTRFIRAHMKRKQLKAEIMEVSVVRKEMMAKEK